VDPRLFQRRMSREVVREPLSPGSGHRTVDDYLDTFLTLVSDAGYTDPRTLVVKFCRGLKTSIQS